jgi:hypothetical protein
MNEDPGFSATVSPGALACNPCPSPHRVLLPQLIILDECDAMTKEAQMALRRSECILLCCQRGPCIRCCAAASQRPSFRSSPPLLVACLQSWRSTRATRASASSATTRPRSSQHCRSASKGNTTLRQTKPGGLGKGKGGGCVRSCPLAQDEGQLQGSSCGGWAKLGRIGSACARILRRWSRELATHLSEYGTSPVC